MGWLVKIWLKMNGWKSVIGYVLAQLPWFTDHPMIVDAVFKVLAHPDPSTPEGAEAWGNLIVQVLLVLGIIGIVRKNVKYGTMRIGETFVLNKTESK